VREQGALGLLRPRVHVGEQLIVDQPAHHRHEFLRHRVDDARLSDERRRVLGAPPAEILAACAPVPAVPLRDARDDVATVLDLVVAPQRQLPADVGLQRDVALLVVQRHHVQGTARAAMEIGPIEEDARPLDQLGHDLAVLLHPRGGGSTLGLELPLVVREPLRGLLDAPAVLLVGEVGAVAATSLDQLGRGAGQHSLAPVTEDAGPITLEESHVEHPRPLALGVLETDPFVGVGGNRRHRGNLARIIHES
jgi:hypothetical protein